MPPQNARAAEITNAPRNEAASIPADSDEYQDANVTEQSEKFGAQSQKKGSGEGMTPGEAEVAEAAGTEDKDARGEFGGV
jgi:hypothetical protein